MLRTSFVPFGAGGASWGGRVMHTPVSVLIADDHAFSSAGLQRLLMAEDAFYVLKPVATGLDAIAEARVRQPDLAILDYAMPGANGLEAMHEIRRWSPKTRVAILTGSTSPALMASLTEARVDGLFLKTSDPQHILDGLRRVALGERVISPEIQIDADAAALSHRELQILSCIAEGLTNGRMAERLSISVKTVESHRASLMRKLGVHSTASLLVRAMQDGLIVP